MSKKFTPRKVDLPGSKPSGHTAVRREIRDAFSAEALTKICLMKDTDFWYEFGDVYPVDQRYPFDYFVHKDNGSKILGIAHLDSVDDGGKCAVVDTSAGLVVHSGTLDDRLGVYVITHLLNSLGITCDWLLTTGEESGMSTAKFFDTDKKYNWMFQFDRGGTDVVLYDYDNHDMRDRVKDTGAWVGNGSFSDICYLEHLKIKGVNWGVGYRDYHGPRAHAYLEDTFKMVEHFARFYHNNKDIHLPHTHREKQSWSWTSYRETGEKAYADYDYTYKSWKTKHQGWTRNPNTGIILPREDEGEDSAVLKIHDLPQPVNNVDDILEEGRGA